MSRTDISLVTITTHTRQRSIGTYGAFNAKRYAPCVPTEHKQRFVYLVTKNLNQWQIHTPNFTFNLYLR